MFTTVGWSESIDAAGAFVNLTAIPDPSLKTSGDNIYVPNYANLLMGGMAYIGTNAEYTRLDSPTIRRVGRINIQPVVAAITPATMVHHGVSPNIAAALALQEPVQVNVQADPAAAEQITVNMWLAESPIEPVRGEIFTVRASITLALVVNTWAFSEVNFADELPVGDYAIVGLRAVIAAGVVIRAVPTNSTFRPGAPCVSALTDYGDEMFRHGNLGVWCTFNTGSPPGFEVCTSAAAASATYQIFIDLMRIGA